MSSVLEPPSFVSDSKRFSEYKKDLLRWSRLTSVKEELQAEMVVYRLEGHPSNIKEKIVTQIGDKLVGNKDGIKELLELLEKIYGEDDLADTYEKYVKFKNKRRGQEESVHNFIADWDNAYHQCKNAKCVLPDIVLCFELLQAAQLGENETQLVLTGVDFKEGKKSEDLLDQMKASLKKFKGRAVLGGENSGNLAVKTEGTYITQDVEKVLIAKGWKKPKKRRRSGSAPGTAGGTGGGGGYMGRKNNLGSNGLPMKCYKCKCEHEEKCNCPCVYHFADKCTGGTGNDQQSKKTSKGGGTTSDARNELGLMMTTEVPHGVTETLLCMDSQWDEELCLLTATMEELVLITRSEELRSLLDCACPTTVTGLEWLKTLLSRLSEKDKKSVEILPSNRVYKFGGGEKRASKYIVRFPCNLAGKNVFMKTEVIDENLPLLLGNSSLKAAGAILHISEQKAIIMGREVKMREESSGHFSLEVREPSPDQEFTRLGNAELCFLVQNEELSEKNIWKLHHYWGHLPAESLAKLIKDAGRMDEEVKKRVSKLDDCEDCRKNDKRKPRPKIALPRASKPNEVVSLDLKEFESGEHSYILYAVDLFSRLTVATFIPNKRADTVAEGVLKIWISQPGLGPMDTLHTDRGSEFLNEILTKVAEYLQIKQTSTAAYTPNANGINERNHSVVDNMMTKMLSADPDMKKEVALLWSMNAKNTLANNKGFSPAQVHYGQNPRLPSLFTCGPPGFEEVSITKSVAQHINAMHLARESFISCESDRILKLALKQRVYKKVGEIFIGDWIYYKNHRKWEGPVKVTSKDGKLLYAVRANRLLTINADNVLLAKNEGEIPTSTRVKNFLEAGVGNIPTSAPTVGSIPASTPVVGSIPASNPAVGNIPASAPDAGDTPVSTLEQRSVAMEGSECDLMNDDSITLAETSPEPRRGETEPDPGQTFWMRPIGVKDVRKDDLIRYKRTGESEWITGEVGIRAGKSTSRFKNWWNIRNVQTGHQQPEDLEQLGELEKITVEEVSDNVEEVETYAVNVPYWRYHEKECRKAIKEELEKFDGFNVYEEVPDDGQKALGCRFVLTEKFKDDKKITKARLCIRGDQEDTGSIRTDSPTVKKSNIKLLLTVAATEGWDVKTSDVTAAFLQSVPIEREVLVKPPKEKRVPGMLWKLKRTAYGLVDASRGFYLSFSGKLAEFGCEKSLLDPAMFLFFGKKVNKDDEVKVPLGLAVTHVDDMLHAGGVKFDKDVIEQIKETFKFGTEEQYKFRYVGLNVKQEVRRICVDQNHYINSLEEPDMKNVKHLDAESKLDENGQTEFRSAVAKLSTVAYTSRPDFCFEVKAMSSKYGNATKSDLRKVQRKIILVKADSDSVMIYPKMNNIEDWVLVGHGDAGIKSMPDKMTSVGGRVILLCNRSTGAAAILSWQSKKLRRKVTSSLAGECYSMIGVIGELVYTKAVIAQIYGQRIQEVPCVVVTDCKNLYEAVHSTSMVEDMWLITDIASIKDALERKEVTEIQRVPSERMLANCLTKAGASGEELMTILKTGKYTIPQNWLQNVQSKS